jgi:hypothetical protein
MEHEDTVITVRVPPQRLRWLAAELREAGIPFQVERVDDGYHVQTYEAAAPQLQRVLNPQRRGRGFVERLPVGWRAVGFALSLAAVGAVYALSAGLAPAAAGAGLNPDLMRGAVILAAGVGLTLFVSETAMRGDGRRGLFIFGMVGLFVVVAGWFLAVGAGLPMEAALERLLQRRIP